MEDFPVVARAGSFGSPNGDGTSFPHRWTPGGVTVETDFTGAHLLHLAVAGCVLNDLYREAAGLGLRLDGVRVTASGGFDTEAWSSTGITYRVELDTTAPDDDVARLLEIVDRVAEIPRAVRAGATVNRTA